MQINVTVDCSPQEARAFLGLPDLAPLHNLYIDRMKSLSVDGVRPEEVERMFRLWSAGMSEGVEQMQRLFWNAAGGAAPRG